MPINYYPAIPAATNKLINDQPLMLQNFAGINTWTAVDHFNFASANAGKHLQVTLPEIAVAPVTLANEMALYVKDVAGVSQMFIRPESAGTEVNITGATKATNGTTILPSGVRMVWGIYNTGINQPSGNYNFNFHTAFATTCYVVFLQPFSPIGNSIVTLTAFNATTVNYYLKSISGANTENHVCYFALGD